MSEALFRLDQQVAVVTGGAKGIGKAISEVFARAGAFVNILDIDEAGQEVSEHIREAGGQAMFHPCDQTDDQAVKTTLTTIFDQHQGLHILVNNAGAAQIGTAESTTPDQMEHIIGVNIMGVYHCLHHAIPLMKRSGGGAILNMASIASVTGIPDRFGYSMTKGAVLSMTYSVARDFIGDHIRCNAIGPARIHTPFVDGYLEKYYPGKEEEMFDQLSRTQPIGRMGNPLEVAHQALYLCSKEAGFITGSFYPIDGGFLTLNT